MTGGVDFDLLTAAINDLAFRTLNSVDDPISDNTEIAIDRLRETIRASALALSVSLLEIAEAIKGNA